MSELKDLNTMPAWPLRPFARTDYNVIWSHALVIISIFWWAAFFLIAHATASNFIGSDLSLFQSLPEAIQTAVGEGVNATPLSVSFLLVFVCALLPVVPVLIWKMGDVKEDGPDLLVVAAYVGVSAVFFAPWIRSTLAIEQFGGTAVSLSVRVESTESTTAGLIMLGFSVLICLYFLFRDRTEKNRLDTNSIG